VECQEYFDQDIINAMNNSFYVDDFLYSVPAEDAIRVVQDRAALLKPIILKTMAFVAK